MYDASPFFFHMNLAVVFILSKAIYINTPVASATLILEL